MKIEIKTKGFGNAANDEVTIGTMTKKEFGLWAMEILEDSYTFRIIK